MVDLGDGGIRDQLAGQGEFVVGQALAVLVHLSMLAIAALLAVMLWVVLGIITLLLFGLIAYYFLYPPMQRLMFAGFSQAAAANITKG